MGRELRDRPDVPFHLLLVFDDAVQIVIGEAEEGAKLQRHLTGTQEDPTRLLCDGHPHTQYHFMDCL